MFSQTILHKIFVTMKLEFLWKLQELIYFGFLAPDFDLWGGEGGGAGGGRGESGLVFLQSVLRFSSNFHISENHKC